MTELRKIIASYLNIDLIQIVLSGVRRETGISKVRIRPVFIKEELRFQITKTQGPKELHENRSAEETAECICNWMEQDFKQLQLESRKGTVSVLVSKKGRMTIKEKKTPKVQSGNTGQTGLPSAEDIGKALELRRQELAHNRKKRYILEEGKPVEFLIDLGVMTPEGKVVHSRYDKFRQINRFLEFIEDILPRLAKDREVTILDFGCGKSYLTFAMYYYLHELKQYDVKIAGLDLKKDVIEHCNRLAVKYHYDKLQFFVGDISSYEGADKVDMVVTLHACDTATDFALAKAVNWGASVILSVPCCQHELNRQIANDTVAPILGYGILKERMAALMTDGVRAQLLEQAGYDTQILEFVDMEHTPKNLLIRAVYTGKKKDNQEKLNRFLEKFHLQPTLKELLEGGNSK